MKKAIILISGGLDSTTVLAIAREQGFQCYCLSFDYGQRHAVELKAAMNIAKKMQVAEHRIIPLAIGELGGSALTDHSINVPAFSDSHHIPTTYVPARNTVFLSIALGWAEILGAYDIFTGICSIDYSHYPDCRPEFIEAFQQMANLATKTGIEGNPIRFHSPLLYLSKAEAIQIGYQLGVDYSLSISCYQANQQGEACGYCDSCTLRKKGFKEANIADPTRYAHHAETSLPDTASY